jgi:hypothetical protein
METNDLLCSRNAQPQKVRRRGVRVFLCSRSARPKKGLARRPQSKAAYTLAWLSDELKESNRLCARERAALATPLKRGIEER